MSAPGWLQDAARVDDAVYQAIARTPTPELDRAMSRLSRAADHSKPWIASAALMAATGGARARGAAADGLSSLAVTSALVNGAVKPLARRTRPDRIAGGVPTARHVRMPLTHSFPSGHSASAFAFATGVAHTWPQAAIPLRAAAALVAYSRVHTGVHFPGDVVVGALLGVTVAQLTTSVRHRRRS